MDDQWELRVRNILDFQKQTLDNAEEGDLPSVTDNTLEIYLNYLKSNVKFPFKATYDREVGPFETEEYEVKVIGIDDHTDDFYGLICEARKGRKKQFIALAELIVNEDDPNYTLLDDYLSWFWNNR